MKIQDYKAEIKEEFVNIINSYQSKYYKYYVVESGLEKKYFPNGLADEDLPRNVKKEIQIVFQFDGLKEIDNNGKYVFLKYRNEKGESLFLEKTVEKRLINNPEFINRRYIFGIVAKVYYIVKASQADYPKNNIKKGDEIIEVVKLEVLPEITIDKVMFIKKTV